MRWPSTLVVSPMATRDSRAVGPFYHRVQAPAR